ncbi:MAG: hypothetical protein LQ349_009858 [Xanthoria aureola]|nr:MAG: hypothetical protein LQ349_009858 [Xanthoria aureola]
MKYSLVGAAIIASTVMTAAAPVDDKGILGPRSAAYAGLSQPSEEQGSLRRRENSAYFGGQERGRLATRTDEYPDKHPDKYPGKDSKSRSRSRSKSRKGSKSRSSSKGKGKDYEHPNKDGHDYHH